MRIERPNRYLGRQWIPLLSWVGGCIALGAFTSIPLFGMGMLGDSGGSVAVLCVILAIGVALAVVGLILARRYRGDKLVVVFRNFENPTVTAVVSHVLKPIAETTGYWITLADKRISYRNTGYDVGPAGAVYAATTLVLLIIASLVYGGSHQVRGLSRVMAFSLGMAPALLTYVMIRRARRIRVESVAEAKVKLARLAELASKRAPSLRLPFLSSVSVGHDVWQPVVVEFVAGSDLVVAILDDAVASPHLQWELQQARDRPLVKVTVTRDARLRIEWRRDGCPFEEIACHHAAATHRVRSAFLEAVDAALAVRSEACHLE